MNEIQVMAARAALKKMAGDGHFCICTIDSILKMSGSSPKSDDYNILRTIHCVKFGDMPQGLLNELPNIVKRVINAPNTVFTVDVGDFVSSLKRIT